MAANMDALLRIKSEMSGDAAVKSALQGMAKLTQQLADTQAKGAAANSQAIQQSIGLNQKLAQATTAAGIDINNAEKQILGSKLQQAKTDKDRQAIQDQLASLEIKNGRLRRQGIEAQLDSEVQLAVKKRDAIQLELKRAQAAVATAGKYGQITPEIVRQAEAARRNLTLAEQEVRVTTQIAAEKRKVADAQLKATEAQAQMSRAVETTKSKMSALGQVISGLGIADLARRMGDFAKSTLEAGEQSGLIGTRIKNLAGQFNETAAVTKLAADSAKRYGLGQIEAADSVSNLYARLRPMGISLEQISSTFIGVNNAAKQAGLSTYDAGEAFRQLGQAMGSGRLQGDELRSLMERMPAIGRAIVDVFNDIARSKGLEQISKEKADVLIKQTKEGEKRQTEILKEQASLRIEALRGETDKHLGEIAKRYRRQQQLMEDGFEDQDDAVRRSNDRQLDATIDGINERAEVERKAIDRRFEDRRKIIEDDKAINEAQKTQLLRNLDDEKSAVLKAVEDREESATTRVRDAADARNKELSRLNRDARQVQMEQLQSAQQAEEDTVKASMERQKATLEAKLKADIEANKQATATTLANLVASTRVTVGELKQLGADGVITTDIIVMAMKKLEQIQPPPPTAMQQFTAAMADLRMELGENLLPLLTPAIQLLTGLLRAFSGLPEPVKAVAGGLLVLAGALGALALPLAGFVGTINLLAGTGALAAITGGLGAIAAFLISWPVLLVAAGVALFVFRDQIFAAVAGILESIKSTFKTVIDLLALNLEIIGKAVYGAVDGINKGIQSAIKGVWDWASNAMGNVAKALVRPFEIAANSVKEVFRSVLQFVADRVNTAAALVNNIIDGYNRIPVAPDLPRIPIVQVPSFEGGGYTGNAPRIGGIDGRGGFPAILHPRETVIDHTRAGRSNSTPTSITIPITTGPVTRLPDGTDAVSMEDFQAGMQSLAAGILGQLGTPAGRMALRGA
jgi:tape measure domain-containing protein